VLEQARTGKARSVDELVRLIDKAGHLDFTRFESRDGLVSVVPCRSESVARTVDLAFTLGLVSDGGQLTRIGRSASDEEHFDSVLREALSKHFADSGAPVARIISIIRDIYKRMNSEELSAADVIFESLGTVSLKREAFSTLLSLYATCGGIPFTRRKLYLPVSP
jgi:hypothetical protein